MKHFSFGLSLFAIVAILFMTTGCPGAGTGTPAAPADPPQVQVLKYAQLATASGDTASHVLVALCVPQPPQQAVLDLTTCNQVKTVLLTVKTFVDRATVEANKVPATESWAVARINIAVAAASIANVATVNNPALQTDLDSLNAVVKQILGVQ